VFAGTDSFFFSDDMLIGFFLWAEMHCKLYWHGYRSVTISMRWKCIVSLNLKNEHKGDIVFIKEALRHFFKLNSPATLTFLEIRQSL
jgi:hypothetical protein